MKKILKNPVVTFLFGILISNILSSVQNGVIDNLLMMIPITALASIFLSVFIRKCEED